VPGSSLVLKLVLTPALIAAASLAGRRWGPAVSGWFVGLPLTSGPVAFFLALDHGPHFATGAAAGALGGAAAEAAFCLAYAALARRGGPAALAAATVAFAGVAALLQRLVPSTAVAGLGAFTALLVAARLMPSPRAAASPGPPPSWDLPARMLLTTVLVLVITGAAPAVGPRLSGVLATYPLYAAILAVFAHRTGAAAAIQVLRGLLLGLFAFAAFFVALATLLVPAGILLAFTAATTAALIIQTVTLTLVLRRRGPPAAQPDPR
jgi:hypothetical protein